MYSPLQVSLFFENLTYLDCGRCKWLFNRNNDYKSNIERLTKIQIWYKRRKFLINHKYLFFLIECIPPGQNTTLGGVFPEGGYMFKETVDNI